MNRTLKRVSQGKSSHDQSHRLGFSDQWVVDWARSITMLPLTPQPLSHELHGGGGRRFREGERGTERLRDQPNRGPILRVLLGFADHDWALIGRGR